MPSTTHTRLLSEGLAAFLAKGYHGTGIQHIVSASGVPKGSFYNHFGSKEEMAVESIERFAAGIRQRLDESFTAEDATVLEIVDEMLGALIEQQEAEVDRQGCLLGNLTAEVATTSDALRAALELGFVSWREPFERLFERGQAEGSVRDDLPPRELADFLLDVWEGALLRMRIEAGSTRALEERRRQLVDHLLPASDPTRA